MSCNICHFSAVFSNTISTTCILFLHTGACLGIASVLSLVPTDAVVLPDVSVQAEAGIAAVIG